MNKIKPFLVDYPNCPLCNVKLHKRITKYIEYEDFEAEEAKCKNCYWDKKEKLSNYCVTENQDGEFYVEMSICHPLDENIILLFAARNDKYCIIYMGSFGETNRIPITPDQFNKFMTNPDYRNSKIEKALLLL